MASNRPISIEFVAEVADFLKGARGVEVSIEDVADALMAASNDSKDLQRKMSRAMKDAEKDVESLERVIKDLPKATEKAADASDKDFDRIGDDARDAGREVGDEFRQNLGESLSSGSLEDIVGDTLGGLVGSMSGPFAAPAVAGAAIAAYMWTAFKQNEEARIQATESVYAAFDEITGEIDRKSLLRDAFNELGGGKGVAVGLKDAAKYAEALQIDMGEYATLITGEVNPGTDALLGKLREQLAKSDEIVESQHVLTPEQTRYRDAIVETIATTELQRQAMGGAITAQEAWTAATKGTGANMAEIGDEAKKAAAEALKIGTGNEALDGLLEKVQDMGVEALSADEVITILGSNNTALDPLKRKMQDTALAALNAKDTLGQYPDPRLESLVNAMRQSRADATVALEKLQEINRVQLGRKSVVVDFTDRGGQPVSPFITRLG